MAALWLPPRGISYPGAAMYLWDFSRTQLYRPTLALSAAFFRPACGLDPFLSLWSSSWSKDCLSVVSREWWPGLIFQSLEAFSSPILQTPPHQNVRAGILLSAVPSDYCTESSRKGISPWNSCGSKMEQGCLYQVQKEGEMGWQKKKKIEGRSPYHLVPISLVVGELWSILKCVTCSCWSAHPHRSNCKNRLSREKSGFLYSSSRWQALSVLFIPSVQKWVCSVPATLEKTFYTTRTILSVLEHQLLDS